MTLALSLRLGKAGDEINNSPRNNQMTQVFLEESNYFSHHPVTPY